jgi:CBS domain containing-hemolysin-like protein
MSDATALILGVGLLLGNAFFVAASFAVVSVRRSQLEPAAETGNRRARVTINALRRASLLMAGAQLGITICTLGLGALTEPALAHVLEPAFVWAGVPDELTHPVAVAPALLIVTALHVIIGEMVPKNLTLAAPHRTALALAPVLDGFVRLAGPVVTGLNAIAAGLLRLVRVQPQQEVDDAVTHEQVGLLLAESRREGLINPDIHHRTSHVLAFTERPVTDALVPIDQLVIIDATTTAEEVEALAGRTGHSRFPRRDETGTLTGYVHLKDALRIPAPIRSRPLPDSQIRPLPVVTPDTTLIQTLTRLRQHRAHAARVDAPDGTTLGAITLDGTLHHLIPRDHAQPSTAKTVPHDQQG